MQTSGQGFNPEIRAKDLLQAEPNQTRITITTNFSQAQTAGSLLLNRTVVGVDMASFLILGGKEPRYSFLY